MAKNNRNTKAARMRSRTGAAPAPLELLPPTQPATLTDRWLPIAIIMLLVFVVYIPSIDNEFVSWDDDHYIFKNPQVSYDDGIKSIWFDRLEHSDPKFRSKPHEKRVSHQYYPMVFSIYWIEFRFHKWFNGADPEKTIEKNIAAGKMTPHSFHVVSVVFHAINVMLLIFCFRALGISNWVAWAATIIFALHPMQVATVAWAAERKNIISLMFYLLSVMSYIKLRRNGGWWRYALSLVLFQAALFSKTVSLTLPIVLFFTDRLLERKWDPKLALNSMLRLLPFVVLSCLAAYSTIQVEDRARTIPLTEEQRPLLPAASLLFYPGKMLLPIDQSPVYELWSPDPAGFLWYLPTLGVLALGALIVVFRRRLGPHFMWALLFYVVTMGPMLGFKNINYFQFSFVADHYFYHGAVGLCLMAALGFDVLRRSIKPPSRGFVVATGLVSIVAIACGVKTWIYCDVWQNSETFWGRTIAMNDQCWPAYFNTANARIKKAYKEKDPVKRAELLEDAAQRYQRVADIRSNIIQPFDQLLKVRKLQKNWVGGYETAREATRRFSFKPEYFVQAGTFAERAGEIEASIPYFTKAAELYLRKKRIEAAINCYSRAASAARRSGKTADCIKHFKQAAQLAIQYADSQLGNGDACAAAKSYTLARQYYKAALQQDQDNADLRNLVASAQQKKRQAASSCNP